MSYLSIRLITGLLYQAVRSLLILLYVILFLPILLYQAITSPSKLSFTNPFAALISSVTNSDEYIAISETISDFNEKPMDSQTNFITTSYPAPYATTSPVPYAITSPVPYATTSPVPYATTSPVPYATTSLEHPNGSDVIDNSASKEERGWLANPITAYFVRSKEVSQGARKDSGPISWGSISWNPIRLSGPLGVDISALRELESKAWEGDEEIEY